MGLKVIASGVGSQLSWTPDGRILYKEFDQGENKICVIKTNSTDKQVLVDKGASQPAYSPDGNFVAFCHQGQQNSGLSLLDVKTLETTLIFKRVLVRNIAWSPNSRYIAFMAESEKTAERLYVYDLDMPNQMPIAGKFGNFSDLTWSPDSTVLAATHQSNSGVEIVKMFILSGKQTFREGNTPAWSSQDALAYWTHGEIKVRIGTNRSYSLEAQSANFLQWSKDGSTLYFVGQVWKAQGFFAVRLGSQKPRLQISNAEQELNWLTVSPDNQRVAFTQPGLHDGNICVYTFE